MTVIWDNWQPISGGNYLDLPSQPGTILLPNTHKNMSQLISGFRDSGNLLNAIEVSLKIVVWLSSSYY